MKIVGFAGPKQSGKSTGAMVFADNAWDSGLTIRLQGFADLMKVSAARSLGFDRPSDELIELMDSIKLSGTVSLKYIDPHTNTETLHALSGREYLEWYGTEGHRDLFGEEFWVNQLFDSLDQEDVDVLIIPDVRFGDEATEIIKRGGDIIKIARNGQEYGEHSSDQDLDNDYVTAWIDNSGTMLEYEEAVEQLARHILSERP